MAEEKNNSKEPIDNPDITAVTNSEKQNSDSKTSTEEAKNEEQEKEPTLAEDYESLKNMHLLRNVMIRMQFGKYPNKKIDGILKRRMDLDGSQFQGTDIVRIIVSIMTMFFICSGIYLFIWLIASNYGLYDLKETSSLVLSLFFICSCSFVVFNNLSIPDEKKLKVAIKKRLTEIENELKIEKKENDNNSKK